MTLRKMIDGLLDYDLSSGLHLLLVTAEIIFYVGITLFLPQYVASYVLNEYTKKHYPASYDESGNANWKMTAICTLIPMAFAVAFFFISLPLFAERIRALAKG